MEAHATEKHVELAKLLSEWRRQNRCEYNVYEAKDVATELGVEEQEARRLLEDLESFGAIEVQDRVHRMVLSFGIRPFVDQLVHQADAQERAKANPPAPDRVEGIKETFRRHPVAAWIIVSLLALSFLVVLANQAMELLERLGVIDP